MVGLNYYIPGGVLRWVDDHQPSVREQLRRRRGAWAVLGENITRDGLGMIGTPWMELREYDEVEVDVQPVDDGEYGVLYEVRARWAEDEDDA